MKNIAALLFVLVIATTTYAQFTATNLLTKAGCETSTCVDELLVPKGYTNRSNQASDGDTTFYYTYEGTDLASKDNVFRFEKSAMGNVFTFITYNKKTFDGLLKGFLALGFTSTNKVDGPGTSDYIADKYPNYALVTDVYGSPGSMAYSFIITFSK